MIHDQPHPLAGKTVRLNLASQSVEGLLDGGEFRVLDWWDREGQGSWMFERHNPACMMYGARSGLAQLPTDDEVVYGKAEGRGYLVHASEIGAVIEQRPPRRCARTV